MRPILLETGSPFDALRAQRGGYAQWFADAFGWPMSRFAVYSAPTSPELPNPRTVDGVVVTGSPLSVHERPEWSTRAGRWLVQAVEAGVPVLGVCYGHQLLGDMLGGESAPNPNGREVGVVEVEADDDPLFEGLGPRFPVVITHSDAVVVDPPGARIIARNAITPNQAMAIGEHCRTVQWHPEMDAHIIREIIRRRAETIDRESGPGTAARLLDAVVGTHTGPLLLRNWVEHFLL